MTLAHIEQLAVVLAAVALLTTLGVLGIAVVRLRRRWRQRHRLLSIARRGLAGWPTSRVTEGVAATVGSPSWWLVQRDRHAMWRSVAAAQRAVSVAARADAPVGDLPTLARQLKHAANGVDAALRASIGERRVPRDVTADRTHIVSAAADIRVAALASLQAMRVDVQPVVSAISVEVAALTAGIQAARFTA